MKKYYYPKCIMDFIFAFTSIMLLLPLLLIIALLIKIESKGPIFFLQERLGQNGTVFKIYKFRTMVNGAINLGSGLHTYEGDTRITKIGRILRKSSLDELPQLVNVLKGEMSIIGPRPPVPYYPRKYEEYSIEQKKRFLVKPGLSGYAQVKFRNEKEWDDRIVYDIKYVENMSFGLDIYIFFKTIYCVFRSENIYSSKNNMNKVFKDI